MEFKTLLTIGLTSMLALGCGPKANPQEPEKPAPDPEEKPEKPDTPDTPQQPTWDYADFLIPD